jgi:hypothetical protein
VPFVDFTPLGIRHLHQQFRGSDTICVLSGASSIQAKISAILLVIAVIGHNVQATARTMAPIDSPDERQDLRHRRPVPRFIEGH